MIFTASIGHLAYTIVDDVVDMFGGSVGSVMRLFSDSMDRAIGIVDSINDILNGIDQASTVGIVFGLFGCRAQESIHIEVSVCMVDACCIDIQC